MKYRTVNGKIRHAVEPIGVEHHMERRFKEVEVTCECGYHVCAKTGPCEPKPAPMKVPLHYHVFGPEIKDQFIQGLLYRMLMISEQKEEPECK